MMIRSKDWKSSGSEKKKKRKDRKELGWTRVGIRLPVKSKEAGRDDAGAFSGKTRVNRCNQLEQTG
jgi:hypothetical protein